MSKFPSTWKNLPLGVVAEVINGRAYKLSEWEQSGTPVIRLQNLTQGGGSFYYSKLDLPKKQYCEKGDLLFMWSASFGPYIWWGDKAIFHYHIWKMLPKDGLIDKKYLYYQLLEITESWKARGSGSTMTHLTKSGIENETLNIPPLPEQKKIAEILSGIDKLVNLLQIKKNKYECILSSYLRDPFEIKQTMNLTSSLRDELTFLPIEEVCLKIVDCKNRTPPYVAQGIPVVRTPNVRHGRLISNQIKFTDKKSFSIWTQRLVPEKDDLLFTREAPLGEACLVPSDYKLCLGQRMMLFRPDKGKVLPGFLLFAVRSEIVQKQLKLLLGGSTVGHARVGDLKSIKIPILSLTLQKRILEEFDSIEKMIILTENQIKKLQYLHKSVSEDLFSSRKRVNV